MILGSRGYPSTYGGFETFVRRLAPWLVERGHEVTVYGRGGMGTRSRHVDGVYVVDTVGLNTKAASTISHGITAAVHCLRHKPDVVLALNVANGPAIPILKIRGIPVAMNVDGIEWKRAKWGRIARGAFQFGARTSARLSECLVADSREIGRIWREEFDVEPVYIPYGADVPDEIGHGRLRQVGVDPRSYVVVVARLAPENNVDLFLDAMELARWRMPIVVVGSANYDNPTEARLRVLDAEQKIRWLGHVADQDLLTELWGNAAVYFHGHSVGGTNPALLSALGCGAPTVAVDTPYNREVLGGGDQVVEPDPVSVRDAIQRVFGNAEYQSELGQRGRAIVHDRYRWTDVFEAYERLLLDMASGR